MWPAECSGVGSGGRVPPPLKAPIKLPQAKPQGHQGRAGGNSRPGAENALEVLTAAVAAD